MKLYYKGKYDLNPDSLPYREHKPNAVAFKEAKDSKTMSYIATIISLFVFAIFAIMTYLRYKIFYPEQWLFCAIVTLCIMFPHEFLHAVCFKEDVYLYTNLKQGSMFVVGPESMSKARFIFMSLFPNIVFGFIPFLIGMIFPQLYLLAAFGSLTLTIGAGDYYNVYNALTQMPKGAKTYLYKFNSFWYMPNELNE